MHEITIYTTSNCPFCHKEKEWLNSKGLSFNEKNVEQDTKAAEDLSKLGSTSVPTTVIDSKTIIIGFDKERIEKELGDSKKDE